MRLVCSTLGCVYAEMKADADCGHAQHCSAQAEEVAAWLGPPAGLKMEVGSEQAFLCERPRLVTQPIRMRGWPKMWGLPPEVVQQGEACLAEPQVWAWKHPAV